MNIFQNDYKKSEESKRRGKEFRSIWFDHFQKGQAIRHVNF